MIILLMIIQLTLPGTQKQGDRNFCYDARSCGLGGISIILENGMNPATMGLNQKVAVSVSGELTIVSEKRGLRVYDSYGNNMGISTVVSNQFTRSTPVACSFVFPFRFLRAGVQFHPLWDYNYSFTQEYRDDFYQLSHILTQDMSGRAYAISPMLGVTFAWVHAGVSQRFLYGTRSNETRVIYIDGPDSVAMDEYDINGMTTQFGILFTPSIHIHTAYTYQMSYTIENQNNAVQDNFPEQHALGIMYRPPVRIPTAFFTEVQYESWDKAVLIYKIGVEHTLMGAYALRYGFCLFPDYAEPSIWTTVLTIGLGLHRSSYHVDIGYALGKRDYMSQHYGNITGTENLHFDEAVSTITISFSTLF